MFGQPPPAKPKTSDATGGASHAGGGGAAAGDAAAGGAAAGDAAAGGARPGSPESPLKKVGESASQVRPPVRPTSRPAYLPTHPLGTRAHRGKNPLAPASEPLEPFFLSVLGL